ncbi:MAG: LOG family protein [Alphaproteobacteria bacterium]|nr:LOG family protein [Alphaproteobacteria bacterium]MDE2042987.1 LOG family protein [Alphaproteobacteria bacterium]MDE2340924.1 LOG family protein [Alphaproteobacteria bacterium]
MSKNSTSKRIFPHAAQDAKAALQDPSTAQTRDPAYRLAFQDMDFLLRQDLRPVRFQLELLKPQIMIEEAGIASTFVFYGSARTPSPENVAHSKLPRHLAYYEAARELARLVSAAPLNPEGKREYVVCSGGGPGIMEGANRGAVDVGAETVGLNIVLPFEQAPNHYITPHLSFNFHYFALRKMHFLIHARAVAVFPGGYGTFDELFELLTLMQTRKIKRLPVVLFGERFWRRVIDFEALADEGVIAHEDLDLLRFVENAKEAWDFVQDFYK